MSLNDYERQLLTELGNMPLNDQIFANLAKKMDIPPSQLVEDLKNLKQKGLLRRWGVYLNSRSLKYTSALVALQVPNSSIEELKKWVMSEKGVTHCYSRRFRTVGGQKSNHPFASFNIWLTLTSLNKDVFEGKLVSLRKKLGISEESTLVLPSQKKFKLRFDFNARD